MGMSSTPNTSKAAYLVAVVHANTHKRSYSYLIGLSSAPNTSKAAYLVAMVHTITPTLSNRPTWWPRCMQIPVNVPTLSNRPELRA